MLTLPFKHFVISAIVPFLVEVRLMQATCIKVARTCIQLMQSKRTKFRVVVDGPRLMPIVSSLRSEVRVV